MPETFPQPTVPPSAPAPARNDGPLARWLPLVLPALVAASTYVAGPLILPRLFEDPADRGRGQDRVMWGLAALAAAAVAYALLCLYRAM